MEHIGMISFHEETTAWFLNVKIENHQLNPLPQVTGLWAVASMPWLHDVELTLGRLGLCHNHLKQPARWAPTRYKWSYSPYNPAKFHKVGILGKSLFLWIGLKLFYGRSVISFEGRCPGGVFSTLNNCSKPRNITKEQDSSCQSISWLLVGGFNPFEKY